MTTPATCPLCRAAVDPTTGRCLCRPVQATAENGSRDLLAKAEALFESYLAARVVHARRRAREAKIAFLRDPRNRQKGEVLHEAEREATLLEVQLVEQTRKARHARGTARDAAGPTEPAPSAEPPSTPVAPSDGRPSGSHSEPAERECPRCAARVPRAVTECRCGYSFALPETGAESALLGEDEQVALRRGNTK